MTDRIDTLVEQLRAGDRPGVRKVSPSRPSLSLSVEQEANRDAKVRFVKRICEVLGHDESVRDLATFFGVAKSTLHERMRLARTDLAPLPEWFEKLDRYEEFMRLNAEFARTA